MKKTILLLLLIPILSVAQTTEYFTGCIIDEEEYSKIPVKATQLTRAYTVLPKRVSLLQYCPTPGDQGRYGTCTSWAIAYAARTIMEAQLNECTDPATNAKEAFSPSFVYGLIRGSNACGCDKGTRISHGLELLKTKGVPKKSVYFESCATTIPAAAYTNAVNYKIEDYFTLFLSNATAEQRVTSTKKALSEGRPVIIAMRYFKSFSFAKDLWNGDSSNEDGSHAMCVVGYDDEKYGGAFHIMNSWGTGWGSKGFTWVTYSDYGKHVREGYEMYLGKKKPKPASPTLSGSMEIKLATGGIMSVKLSNSGSIRTYKVPRTYPSGTRYRIMLSNHEPAYVYVLGADLTGQPELLFPPTSKVSPALVYASNDIAIPDEQWYIETDNTVGTDYLCVLYAQSALNIDDIIARIARMQGAFPQKIASVLGTDCVADSDISYGSSAITFSTTSSRKVVPVIVEIPHGK